MSTLTTYFFAVNAIMIVFYILHSIFIKRDTHFKQHRIYLLFALGISVIIPFLSTFFTVNVESSTAVVLLNTVQIGAKAIDQVTQSSYSLTFILEAIYFVITALLISKLTYQIYVIQGIRKRSEFESTPNGNVYWTDQPTAFSFLNNVFLPNHLRNSENYTVIFNHEQIHRKQYHSIDILFIELVCALFWINPVVWLYRKSIKETHEYLADEVVKEQYNDTNKYEMLLFSHGVGFNMGLANSFNQSLTLKRLIMLTKSPSSPSGKAKILLIIPMAGLLTLGLACSQKEDIPTEKTEKVIEVAQFKDPVDIEKSEIDDPIYTVVEVMPEFPGGTKALMQYLQTNITYPPEAKANGIKGRAVVSFVVTKTGAIENVKLLRSVNELLGLEAIRVVKSMPNWTPGSNKGVNVNVKYNLPISFVLE
ncbi:MAG: M56 family metallopeptidase [Salinivirgaceae bacterium]|nr:M56 family metallopeptidase [Salinivirgaceae bacterium]MDY0280721.1 M56 family metallopeptidase [Salinivirgaceae bacterium]